MTANIVAILSLSALIVQNICSHIERRDLYNRIQSRDLAEYSSITKEHIREPTMRRHRRMIDKWRSLGGGDGTE